jgi:hypothetical protein
MVHNVSFSLAQRKALQCGRRFSAGPLDQSQLAFKELVYGRLIGVFAGKNHGKPEMIKLLLVFHRHHTRFHRRKPAALVLIARSPRPDLSLALLQIGAQLRGKAFTALLLAFPQSFFSRRHMTILTAPRGNSKRQTQPCAISLYMAKAAPTGRLR